MKKLILIVFLITAGSVIAIGQADTTKYWKMFGDFSLTISQVSLTNWAAGGESSFSGNTLLNYNANYKKDKNIWDNNISLGYGTMKMGDDKYWKKTDDKIDLSSKYGYEAFKNWYYAALLSFTSQFSPGYKDNHPDSTKTSDFMAPAYIKIGVGLNYQPNDNVSIYISPATYRLTYVNDTALSTRYGLDAGKNIRNEIGANFKGVIQYPLMKNVDFKTVLELFSDYLKDPQNIDVSWDVILNLKVNEFLSANISTSLIYDHDVVIEGESGPRTQFKEVFGVGLALKF
ncbi:DUF3078 domain-containing protein [Bacteroidota bacterium]